MRPEACGLAWRAIDSGGWNTSVKSSHGIGALLADRLRVVGRFERITRSFWWKTALYLATATLVGLGQIAGARCEKLTVSDGWVQAADEVGVDIPLNLTIRNEVGSPDALLRARCPVSNFSEKHIVDHGEGAPAMRSIPSIPVPANATAVLNAGEYHVMLLQTRRALAVNERFVCLLFFQKAGAIETEVEVRRSP
jgi:periplasmic copper chaperone A